MSDTSNNGVIFANECARDFYRTSSGTPRSSSFYNDGRGGLETFVNSPSSSGSSGFSGTTNLVFGDNVNVITR